MFSIYTPLLLAWSFLAFTFTSTATATAIPTISVKGAKLFANGQQFFIKGTRIT